MYVRFRSFATMLATLSVLLTTVFAQSGKPLTNDDIISMVKNGMPESVIVKAIQSGTGKFDTSPAELVRMHKAGVTESELNAMMGPPAASASATPPHETASPAEPPEAKSRMPKAYVAIGSEFKELPLEKTQLAETKAKPSSMRGLASDSAMTQAMQSGVSTAAWDTANHTNSMVGGQVVQGAGSIFSSTLGHHTPTITYVWGVPNPASANVLKTTKPQFTVDFARAFGVNPEDYEPTIVKLTPAQRTCRIVGATEAKADVKSTPAADWQMYSHFLEERAAATAQKLGPGKYKITTSSELVPGEYGVVLRPVSKTKKFFGGDVARAQGDGLMFDAIWTFQVAEEAQ
jgi:hypothetical protein